MLRKILKKFKGKKEEKISKKPRKQKKKTKKEIKKKATKKKKITKKPKKREVKKIKKPKIKRKRIKIKKPKVKPKAKPKIKKTKKEKKPKVKRKKTKVKKPKIKLKASTIDDVISHLVGEDVVPLVSLLKDKKNVSEFKLAEDLNLSVNQIRNMLYRLHKYNLVDFTRKKDKKKGWYIYYWTLVPDNLREIIVRYKIQKLEEFKNRLKSEEENIFFVCPNACTRLKLETAMEHNFKCPECGELLKQQDNKRTISNLKTMIKNLEEELKEMGIEIKK